MQNRLPIVFILITLVIDSMGIGLILPVMPDLIQDVSGAGLADAAIWGGVLSTSFAAMQFLFGPTVGNISDRFGRRPILLASLLVLAVNYTVMAVAGSIWFLLLLQILSGIVASTQTVATAFMADISKAEDKAANFGLIGAAFGVGFVLGPLIGGLLGEFGHRAPFVAAAILAASNLVFGLLVMPETVTAAIRRPFRWARANPFGAFMNTGRMPGVTSLLLIFFTYEFAFFVYPAIWAYFTTARFGWEPAMIGLSLASFGISMAVVQGTLIRPLVNRLGERGAIVYGLCLNVCAFLALGLVTNGWIALVLTPMTALGAVVTPSLQGIMSKTVPDDAQGELQGLIASARSVAIVFSPLVMTSVFATFTQPSAPVFLPGAPFLLSMSLMFVCGAILYLSPRPAAVGP
ncbi:MAG: TCR/Tet family MFS transporter [Pseudomonadota bacterium]